jgi:hypothetical protein
VSEIEVLLSVDRGRVPPGTVVFLPRDPQAQARILFGLLAVLLSAAAIGCAAAGAGREPVALLALATGMAAIWASATEAEVDQPVKRAMLLVTATGMIVRDTTGLRSWRFDELTEVRPFVHEERIALLVVARDGSRDLVDHSLFERGGRLPKLIGARLQARQA